MICPFTSKLSSREEIDKGIQECILEFEMKENKRKMSVHRNEDTDSVILRGLCPGEDSLSPHWHSPHVSPMPVHFQWLLESGHFAASLLPFTCQQSICDVFSQ